jgi:DNA invertase Pin-like site-specific DNA recombinase
LPTRARRIQNRTKPDGLGNQKPNKTEQQNRTKPYAGSVIEAAPYRYLMDRPGLNRALDLLRRGEANVLMAAKLDRLSRSTRDVCEIGDMARHYRFDLLALNVNIDTTTPEGKVMLGMMALFSELERDLIAQRTRDALKVKRAQGVRLGRAPVVSGELVAKLDTMRKGGMTFQAIADDLNARGVPTGRGGKVWYPGTVSHLLNRKAETVAA